MNRKVVAIAIVIVVLAGAVAAYWMVPDLIAGWSDQQKPTESPTPETTHTSQPPTTTQRSTQQSTTRASDSVQNGSVAGTESFGLLPTWESRYNGTCASCHMDGETLHTAPFHPAEDTKSEIVSWKFLDDDEQGAPNTALPKFQPTNITIDGQSLRCSDCHAVSNPSGFGDPENSAPTRDPHAVHRGVIKEVGCIRCHDASGSTASEWVTSPIDMRAQAGGELLSTSAEAGLPGPTGDSNTMGWTRYKDAASPKTKPGSCGDCHGQYHSSGNLSFTFDRDTRVGPAANAESGAPGLQMGETQLGCQACHATGVHTVHTNGLMSSTFKLTRKEGAKGAESCLVCHGVGVATKYRGHFNPETSDRLGLLGDVDVEPDSTGYNLTDGDCGFCHLRNP